MKIKVNYIILLIFLSTTAFSNMNSSSPLNSVSDVPSQADELNPEEWKFESQREEIAPVHKITEKKIFNGKTALTLSGGGKEYSNGCWYTIKTVVPESFYRFKVYYKANKVEQPWRTVFASIIWMDESDKKVGMTEFPQTLLHKTQEGWDAIDQAYQVPANATKARLELGYRWDADGTVHFGDFSFAEINKPSPRTVRLATILHRPQNSKSTQDNLDQFASLVEEAGKQDADIVCLPEAITLIGTKHNYISASEPVPGPTTRFLGEAAKKYNLYIVAGILEKEGDVVYNTAVLIDRKGELAGKYRKVSLPREEIDGGVMPGEDIPVFDTDFGRIGIMICWDMQFPEVARTLAMKGAEVILVPIWGGDITLTKARAIENQVYLVTSTYDMISAVFDLKGNVIDEATKSNPLAISEVDLNEQVLWRWIGDMKNRIRRELPSKVSTTW